MRELVCSSAGVLAGLTDSSAGLDDPDSEDNEKLRGANPPMPLVAPEKVMRGQGWRGTREVLGEEGWKRREGERVETGKGAGN